MSESFLHGVEVLTVDDGIRPIRTVRSSVIGIVGTAPDADVAAFPANTPVLVAGNRREAAKLDTVGDGSGTLPSALDAIFDQIGALVVVIRVEEGVDDAETMSNVIGGVAGDGTLTGTHALKDSEPKLGFTPRILIAPGFTGERPEDSGNPGTYLANPVVAELEGIANQLRAVIIADGPNTTDADAITYRDDWGSKRIYIVDPNATVFDTATSTYVDRPSSPRVAGMIARTDNDRGFWWSPSNKIMSGIVGTARPIDFQLGSTTSRANLLNEKEVATIIREDGFRLWGNRTTSSDPKWAFLSVVRTADMIDESMLRAHLWAVDRPITKNYVDDVQEGVNLYLRSLVAKGAILGGRVWLDEELNNPASIADGRIYFDFEFTPPYPAERVSFRSHLVTDYVSNIFA